MLLLGIGKTLAGVQPGSSPTRGIRVAQAGSRAEGLACLAGCSIMFCWGIGQTSAGFCSVSSQLMESELPEQAGRVDANMFMLRVNFGWRLPWISAGKRVNFGWHSPGVSLAIGVKVAGVLLLLLFCCNYSCTCTCCSGVVNVVTAVVTTVVCVIVVQ